MESEHRIDDIPTAQEALPTSWHDREAIFRRVGVVVLLAFVVVVGLGVLGPRQERISASAHGERMEVEYPGVSRPGLDTRVTVALRTSKPRAHHLVRVDREAFDVLGLETMTPQPASVRSRGEQVEIEFESTGSSEVEIDLTGRVPTQQPPGTTDWHITHVVDGRVQDVDVTTWVLP